jgi:uncharacterized protein YyaL (SSP411 family)
MSDEQENALGLAASAYLRSARHQPVEWMEWGTAAFEKAKAEEKPVLLDIGAVWCHWCHVMDRESYENAETARIINDLFIAVKVDRDERPDVDARYQAAVSTISGQGGWPLTAFLTPEGKPYFGGTYFPPDDRYGRPGFQRVLLTMAEAFQKKRDEVEESAEGVVLSIDHNESFSGRGGKLNTALIDKLVDTSARQFDERNGGFGSQPKFPHSAAIDLIIDAAGRAEGERTEALGNVARFTLLKMAAGGIHDQLAGGFHRYSVDERWVVPHFEKMAYDNSELLKNYVHAFQAFAEPEFARVARGIVRWMDEWLSDQERGGFYGSQDADDSLDDDGDYFTWTRAEARAVLSAAEFEVAALYFNLRDVGDMHHNPQKNVLHVGQTLGTIAERVGGTRESTRALIESAAKAMYAARLQRKTPYVDKTIYTGWNGMCVSAYLEAGRVLGLDAAITFALKSLDRVLESAWSAADGLSRVVAYSDGATGTPIAGVLEDYAFLANAALDAWEATGELKYFTVAQEIADAMIGKFYDTVGGAFFDAERDEKAIGVMATRRKPLQDAPTPAGNSIAAIVLLRLAALTDVDAYREKAEDTLETFAGVVEHFGLYAATFGLALRRAVDGVTQVCVVGEDAKARELELAALRGFAVNRSVIRLPNLTALPPALRETLPHLPKMDGSFAVVCKGRSCLPPVATVDDLLASLAS